MYVPEDVQFWLDNFCNNVKEILKACEEKYECNSSQSDFTETENLEDVAKNSFQSLCSSPQAMFFLIKKMKVSRILQLSLSVTCSPPPAIAEVSNPKRRGVAD